MAGYSSVRPPPAGDALLIFDDGDDDDDNVGNVGNTTQGTAPGVRGGANGGGSLLRDDIAVGIPQVQGGMDSLDGNIHGEMTLNTLDEPVSETLKRDLLSIWAKVKQVLFPAGSLGSNSSNTSSSAHILRDWDLWGPLLLCLLLSVRLSATAPSGQSPVVFTTTFGLVWVGAAIVTINGKLLGGKLSFFQSVCVLGYCLFPLALCAIITLFVPIIVRFILVVLCLCWATWSSVGFLGEAKLNDRRLLAVYPISLFYFAIAWMILVAKRL